MGSSKQSKIGTIEDLQAALATLDQATAKLRPEVFDALRPSASPVDLELLRNRVGPLPVEIEAWFGWHDGQSGLASISPETYLLMPTSESIALMEHMTSEEQPQAERWPSSWVPLMDNGNCDYSPSPALVTIVVNRGCS